MRQIALSDGTSMGDELIVFKTNAPVDELKKLEKDSCQVYLDGGDYEDVPNWTNILTSKGYTFQYIDSHPHVNQFNSSSVWLELKYPSITEKYVIENQP